MKAGGWWRLLRLLITCPHGRGLRPQDAARGLGSGVAV
jgi:hypothetical protein